MRKCFFLCLLCFFNTFAPNSHAQEETSEMKGTQDNCKTGICLSGGGALGYAHIGVLQALWEHNIIPEVIAGSSMGAVVGALYAQGLSPAEIMLIVEQTKMYKVSKIMHLSLHKGLAAHTALRSVLQTYLSHNDFDCLKYEFHTCVSNLSNATWKTVHSGKQLHEFVVASASIPFVFESVTINDSIYVDGGLFNNMPAQALLGRCDIIIGSDVIPYFEVKEVKDAGDILSLSIRGIEHNNSVKGRSICDFLIEPPSIEKYGIFAFEKYKEIYQIGYDTTIEYIKNHPEIISCTRKNNEPL